MIAEGSQLRGAAMAFCKVHRLGGSFVATLLLGLALASSLPAHAADVALAGQVQHPGAVAVADLQKLPPTTVAASFLTDHGPLSASYTGALLWTVLGNAGIVNGPAKNAKLRHIVLVTARDGYTVALSLGEIDPDYEGKPVILAYKKNGNRMPDLRLIVPGDKHSGRAVYDVVKIAVE